MKGGYYEGDQYHAVATKDASSGYLVLYDPDMNEIKRWEDINELECKPHNAHDACHATSDGEEHSLLVPVPVGLMEASGTYRFVQHMVDDHKADRRDHRYVSPALDLNQTVPVWAVNMYSGYGTGSTLSDVWKSISGCGYTTSQGVAGQLGKGWQKNHQTGNWELQATMGACEHADVVVSGLTGGGGKYPDTNSYRKAPTIFVLLAHGTAGKDTDGQDIAGRAVQIHQGWLHSCAITTNCYSTAAPIADTEWLSANIRPNGLQTCVLAVAVGCGTAHNYEQSMCKLLKDKGATYVIGVDNEASLDGDQLIEASELFLRLFFQNLVTKNNGMRQIHLTYEWIYWAAWQAQKDTLAKYSRGHFTGIKAQEVSFIKLNGVPVIVGGAVAKPQ